MVMNRLIPLHDQCLIRPVCCRDLKTSTQNYIHRVWQETWKQQVLNKLHSIHPSTSHWAALPMRRHDVHLTRLRIGHTRFTHRHLLLGENAPECPSCKVPYSDSIWILTDSRSSIQYLKSCPHVIDSTGLDILSKLVRLVQRKQVCLQWIPSHVGVPQNEVADERERAGWSSRAHQTALARFRSGHLHSMTLVQGVNLSLPVPALSLLLLFIFWTDVAFP
ncbi:putative RNA-directed DNA polymerase from transposon X-element [Trichonephila clavipes]|nr:putative RNA-directed DNA polymerase from transposon X-element [Trichonephila clavipes]